MIIQDDDVSDPSLLDIQHRQKQILVDSQKGNGGTYDDYDSEDLDNYGLEQDEEGKLDDEEVQDIYITQNMKDEVSNEDENRFAQQ